MIRRWALVAVAALLTSAMASTDETSAAKSAFGNTIVLTYPDGRTGHLWLKPTGDYDYAGRGGAPSRGRWRVEGGRMCLKQSRPIPIPFSYCTPMQAAQIGAVWPGKAPTGEPIELKLVEGIVR